MDFHINDKSVSCEALFILCRQKNKKSIQSKNVLLYGDFCQKKLEFQGSIDSAMPVTGYRA